MTPENIKPCLFESKGYILIIQDDDNIRSTFANYLEDFGYQVKLAKDGNDAIALVDHNIFDIALLDICTHDHMDIDLLKEIKEILTRFSSIRLGFCVII